MSDASATTLPRVMRPSAGRRLTPRPDSELETFTSRARIAEAARCSRWRRGNTIDLLIDGEEIFSAMFEAIASARHSILLETYILEASGPGQRLAELLAQKSSEGVEVRLLFDSLGSFGTDRAYFDRLKSCGVKVREFNPVRPWHRRFRWIFNRRTHRKLLIVDGHTAFIGGANFSRVYSGGSARAVRERESDGERPWRDTHARVRGTIAADLQALFLEHWIEQGGSDLRAESQAPPYEPGNVWLALAASAAGSRRNPLYRALLATLRTASQRILVTTAYFVPTRRLVRELRRAADRGVRVALMVPAGSDSWSAAHAGRSRYDELLASGVEIYEHCTSMLHSKTIVIDDNWSSIGSSNMDWRSLLHNAEANVIALDVRLAHELALQFERDAQSCERITAAAWSRRPWLNRICERIVRPFHFLL
jgi:cardiolipin synthase